MILNEVNGSLLSMSVSGHITSFLLFSCMRDQHILQLGIMLQKTMPKTLPCFFSLHSCDDSSEPVPSTISEPVDNRLLTQKGKQTSQE